MEYTVLVYKAEEGGFWAEIPSYPGAFHRVKLLKKQ